MQFKHGIVLAALCLLSLASASYVATYQYVGSSSCSNTFVSAQLLQAGTCLNGLTYSCGSNKATVTVYFNPDCSGGVVTSYDMNFQCTGAGTQSASVNCVSSPPAPSNNQAQMEYYFTTDCSGTQAGYFYETLTQTCTAGQYQYQETTVCSGTTFTVKNCTDSSCTSNCISDTYSSTCHAGKKVAAVNCPGSSGGGSTGGSSPGTSSTGGSGPVVYTQASVNNCMGSGCSGNCQSQNFALNQCIPEPPYAVQYTCSTDGTTVTQAAWNGASCNGAPMQSSDFDTSTCYVTPDNSASTQYGCVADSGSGGGSTGTGPHGGNGGTSILQHNSMRHILLALLAAAVVLLG